MLDSFIHRLLDKPLHVIGKKIHLLGVSANTITLVGFFFGILTILYIGTAHLHQGFFFFLLNRICDGIDGSVARHQSQTERGEFLDIVCNFIIYAGMVFAFILSYPEDAVWGAFLIFSFIGMAASSLAYMTISSRIQNSLNLSEKKNSSIPVRVQTLDSITRVEQAACTFVHEDCESSKISKTQNLKHQGYNSGSTETVMALSFICFFPEVFEFIALGYGLLCWVTTGEYIIKAWMDFKHPEAKTSISRGHGGI